MSFIDDGKHPKLVEEKMLEKITKVQKIIIEQNITWTQQLSRNIWKFTINNIGALIIVIVLILLLYYRYQDVQKKKAKNNNEE